MRRLLPLLGLLATAVAATTAAAAPQSDLVIRPAQGIGKFRLGMTRAEVLRAVGRPRYVVPRGRSFGLSTGWAAPDPPPGRPRIRPSVENYSRYARVNEVIVAATG